MAILLTKSDLQTMYGYATQEECDREYHRYICTGELPEFPKQKKNQEEIMTFREFCEARGQEATEEILREAYGYYLASHS